jgi:hypothetical protein
MYIHPVVEKSRQICTTLKIVRKAYVRPVSHPIHSSAAVGCKYPSFGGETEVGAFRYCAGDQIVKVLVTVSAAGLGVRPGQAGTVRVEHEYICAQRRQEEER